MDKYKVTELAELLGITETAIRKKLKRGDFQTVEEVERNRTVTKILLSNDSLKELINQTNQNKTIYSTVKDTVSEHSENIVNAEYTVNNETQIDKLFKFTEQYINRMENLYKTLSDKDSQIKLIEDSESRTKQEYNRLTARVSELEKINKQLEIQNSELLQKIQQLEVKKSFLGIFKK